MSSNIPSRIDNYLKDIKYHLLQPISITNSVNPTFTLKEDKLFPVSVQFNPTPLCTCSSYKKSIKELSHPICYHIIYILANYYHVNELSIRMYHKLPDNFYETLMNYMDLWIQGVHDIKILKKRRKKNNYDFNMETIQLKETIENQNIINPMFDYYTKQDCVICFDPLCQKQLMICPECFNYSHTKCTAKWLLKKKGCPFCRDNPTKIKILEDEEFPDLLMSSKVINS